VWEARIIYCIIDLVCRHLPAPSRSGRALAALPPPLHGFVPAAGHAWFPMAAAARTALAVSGLSRASSAPAPALRHLSDELQLHGLYRVGDVLAFISVLRHGRLLPLCVFLLPACLPTGCRFLLPACLHATVLCCWPLHGTVLCWWLLMLPNCYWPAACEIVCSLHVCSYILVPWYSEKRECEILSGTKFWFLSPAAGRTGARDDNNGHMLGCKRSWPCD